VAAAPGTRVTLKRLLRWFGYVVAGVLLALAAYALAAWLGSSLARNADWQEPPVGDVVIGVETNGVHTALVLPLVTPTKDWRQNFPLFDIKRPDRPYTHVSISWGERAVFLDTPTWWDLSPRTVLRVLTVGGQGLAHIGFYVRPRASAELKPLRLRAKEYERLVRSIETHLGLPQSLRRHAGYGAADVFYDAPGVYTAVNTCNQWTSNRLADAGVRTGRWTPAAGGVMKWAQAPNDPSALANASARAVVQTAPLTVR
jgi:uncharacterized protein (TIGR02117 family)